MIEDDKRVVINSQLKTQLSRDEQHTADGLRGGLSQVEGDGDTPSGMEMGK